MEGAPRWLVLVVCLTLLAGVGVADLLTDTRVVLSVFYAVPIAVVTWVSGRSVGLLYAVAATALWTASDVSGFSETWGSTVLWWNTVVVFAFFAFVVYLLAALKDALAEEQLLARVDPLTRVANLRQFRERAQAELARARRSGLPISVAVFDVDDLKTVNDRRGHAAGDALLVAVADAWVHSLRASDVIARIGGDEFAALLPDTPAAAAGVAVEKCRAASRTAISAGGWESSLSVGVVTWSGDETDVDALLHDADALMYDVKLSGKDGARSATVEHGVAGATRSFGPEEDRIVGHE